MIRAALGGRQCWHALYPSKKIAFARSGLPSAEKSSTDNGNYRDVASNRNVDKEGLYPAILPFRVDAVRSGVGRRELGWGYPLFPRLFFRRTCR